MRAVFVCSLLLSAVFGCSSDRDAMNKRLAGLRDDITRLQADNDRLGERVDFLEARPTAAATAGVTPAAAPATSGAATKGIPELTRPPLKVVKLVPNAAPSGEVTEGDVPADERVDAPGSRPMIRLYGREARDDRRASTASSRQNSAEDR